MKALITGASSGIGRDMARLLAEKGYDLILVARRTERLEELKKELKNVEILSFDLSCRKNCERLYHEVKSEEIDIVINNAGFGLFGEFCETSLDTELHMIKTNIVAVHILTKLFLKDFCKQNRGYILNVASSAAFLPGPLMACYYSTKAYVLRLTESISEELRRKNSAVSVSALCPGPVDTEFNSRADVKFTLKSLSSERVAKYGIDKMFKRKLVIVPGAQMKLAYFFERFMSDKGLAKISYHMQKRKGAK